MMWLFDLLPWWGWLASTLGIAGIIVFAIMLPEVALLVLQAIKGLLRRLLATRWGCALLAALLAASLADMHRRASDAEACRQQIQDMKDAAAAAAIARDAEIRTSIENKYAPLIDEAKTREAELQEKVNGYEQKIAAGTPNAACVLGDEPLRLRHPQR